MVASRRCEDFAGLGPPLAPPTREASFSSSGRESVLRTRARARVDLRLPPPEGEASRRGEAEGPPVVEPAPPVDDGVFSPDFGGGCLRGVSRELLKWNFPEIKLI